MSSIFSGMSTSHELVIICQSQLSLLVESLGISAATVYLTDSWDGGDASQLQRVAVVPIETVVSRHLQLSGGGVAFSASRSTIDSGLILESAIGSIDGDSSLPSKPAPHNDGRSADDDLSGDSSNQPSSHQIVLPLLQDDRVLGVLVAERGQPWDTIAQIQMDSVRQALISACVLDLRSRWFEQQAQQQQVVQQQQKDLLDNLLHQFRNPLTAMRTFGKLLVKRLVDAPRNQEAADSIVRESDRLQALLLQFEQAIEGGGIKALPSTISPSVSVAAPSLLPATPSTTSLTTTLGRSLNLTALEIQSVLEPAIQSALGIIDDRNQTLQIAISRPSVWVLADQSALTEVVVNLLDNASKYTPIGGQISVELADCDSWVELWITDTGYGIPLDNQDRLFERHYRGVQAQSSIAGTGLGLSIARELTRQMQGEIKVFSPPPVAHALREFHSGTSLQVTLRKAEVSLER